MHERRKSISSNRLLDEDIHSIQYNTASLKIVSKCLLVRSKYGYFIHERFVIVTGCSRFPYGRGPRAGHAGMTVESD